MKKTIFTKTITIAGNEIKIEVVTVGGGQNPKALLVINGQEWTSINLFNFLQNNNDLNFYTEELKEGAYKMFV